MAIVAFEGIDDATVQFVASVVPGVQIALDDEPAEIAVLGPVATTDRILSRIATAGRVVASSQLGNEMRRLEVRPVWVTHPLDRDQVARALAGVLRKARVGVRAGADATSHSTERIHALLSLIQAAVVAKVQRSTDDGTNATARTSAAELARELRRLGALDASDRSFEIAGLFADPQVSVVDLATAVDRLVQATTTLPRGVGSIDVLVVGFDDASAGELVGEFTRQGYGALALADGRVAASSATRDTILVLVHLEEGRPPPWIEEFAARGLLVVVVCEPPDLARRTALVGAGVDTILPYAVRGRRLGRLIVDGLRSDQPGITILVDPDADRAEGRRAHLSVRGIDVLAVDAIATSWSRLREDANATVVFAGDLPDLARQIRLLRSDPALVSTEVIVLAANDPVLARTAGADDLVSDDVELVAALHRARRRRAGAAFRNSTTGTISGLELAEIEARFDAREGAGSVVAFLVDQVDELVAEFGREAGEAVRRRVLLAIEDLAAQLPEGSVIVYSASDALLVAPTTGADELVVALEAVQGRLRHRPLRLRDGNEVTASFSAAVSERGRDGDRLDPLATVARRSLRMSASRGGVARVVRVGWLPEDRRRGIDVLIVDPDDATASVLSHALEQAGFSVARVSSAETAEPFLSDDVGVSVVVTEISLPGVDGFEFLRTVQRRGLASKTRVLVLTRRITEEETVEALRLGAFDHVSKPFSPAILVERVRRAYRDGA